MKGSTNAESRRRVVVTGIGLVTSLGRGREATWIALRQGRVKVWPLVPCEAREGQLHHGFPAPYRDRFVEGFDPSPLLLQDCLKEAVADAEEGTGGRLVDDPERVAVLVGLSKGRMLGLERLHRQWVEAGSFAEVLTDFWPNSGAASVSRMLGAKGPCLSPVAACATGLVAAIQGSEMITRGDCEAAVVGAVDASLSPFLLGAFRSMRALAGVEEGEDARRAIRPWDRSRKGFLVGEGGALLVLEEVGRAEARGAKAYAELAGGAIGSDAHHVTNLNPDPSGLAHLIDRALAGAGVEKRSIDHINVHGTATRSNDPLECLAIRRVFGILAEEISCSANKPQVGHLLGAAGAVELAITCLAIRDGFVPPTLNLEDPDPECDLDATPGVGQSRGISAAIKLSLGFGGHLAVALLKNLEPEARKPPGGRAN